MLYSGRTRRSTFGYVTIPSQGLPDGVYLNPPLRPRVPRLIIDIAAPSVAHYGPVEVLRPPVGRPARRRDRWPDDCTALDPILGGSNGKKISFCYCLCLLGQRTAPQDATRETAYHEMAGKMLAPRKWHVGVGGGSDSVRCRRRVSCCPTGLRTNRQGRNEFAGHRGPKAVSEAGRDDHGVLVARGIMASKL